MLMVSGSDAHGTPISVEADKRGITAREVFEHYHYAISRSAARDRASATICSRTPTPRITPVSRRTSSALLLERGYLYRETQRLLYSETENRFLPDRYVEGDVPDLRLCQARAAINATTAAICSMRWT